MSAQPFAIVAIVLAVAALILVWHYCKMYLLPAISILGIISLQLLNANIMSVFSTKPPDLQ